MNLGGSIKRGSSRTSRRHRCLAFKCIQGKQSLDRAGFLIHPYHDLFGCKSIHADARNAQTPLEPPFPSSLTPTLIERPGLTIPEIEAFLPAFFYVDRKPYIQLEREDDMLGFLHHDFYVTRLNYLHKQLYLAGLPMHYSPLHGQQLMKREISITEQADLLII